MNNVAFAVTKSAERAPSALLQRPKCENSDRKCAAEINPKTTMKNVAFAIVAIVFISSNALAQTPVTDAAAIAQNATNHAIDLAKYVEMVNNQVRQVTLLTNELNQVTAYAQAFGDPASIQKIVGADQLINSINQTGVGQSITQLQQLSNGAQTLQYNANGLYHMVGNNFTTPSGVTVPRDATLYRQFDAIDRTTGNYNGVYDDVSSRRQELKGQIADTTQQLQTATTDAETQKLTGVLIGQDAQLQAIDKELDFAANQAVVQDIENRNDLEKQKQARAEEQLAEFTDAMDGYSETFKINTEPALWSGSK